MSTNFEVPEALPSADGSQRSHCNTLFEDSYSVDAAGRASTTDTSAAALPKVELTDGVTNVFDSSSPDCAYAVGLYSEPGNENVQPEPLAIALVAQLQPQKDIIQNGDKRGLLASGLSGKSEPPPLPPSPFTEPFDKVRAEEAISKLSSHSFKIREEGTGLLRQMGPEALPLLKGALRSDDPEARMRAERVIRTIVGYEDRKAVIEHFDASRKAGPVFPSRRGELAPEEVQAFESHLTAANKFLNADRMSRYNQFDEFGKNAVLDSIDIRIRYAERLLNSEIPSNGEKALSLLIQQLEVPGFNLKRIEVPGANKLMQIERFLTLSARAGGHLSPEFRQSFEKLGGKLGDLDAVARTIRRLPI